ncbi:unnamed protein product, partial [Allacma fusca]
MLGTPGIISNSKIPAPENPALVTSTEPPQIQGQTGGTGRIPPYPNIHSVSSPILSDYPVGVTALSETPVLYIEGEETLNNNDHGKLYTYRIVDAFGRFLYKAEEHSSRRGSSRPFDVFIIDAKKQHIFRICRRSSCSLCFLGSKCYGNNVEVYKTNGELLGEVKQVWSYGLSFEILDGKGDVIMRIEGPKKVNCVCPSIRSHEPMNILSIEPDNPSMTAQV